MFSSVEEVSAQVNQRTLDDVSKLPVGGNQEYVFSNSQASVATVMGVEG